MVHAVAAFLGLSNELLKDNGPLIVGIIVFIAVVLVVYGIFTKNTAARQRVKTQYGSLHSDLLDMLALQDKRIAQAKTAYDEPVADLILALERLSSAEEVKTPLMQKFGHCDFAHNPQQLAHLSESIWTRWQAARTEGMVSVR